MARLSARWADLPEIEYGSYEGEQCREQRLVQELHHLELRENQLAADAQMYIEKHTKDAVGPEIPTPNPNHHLFALAIG